MLHRRLSYLAISNVQYQFSFAVNGVSKSLYDKAALFEPNSAEIIHSNDQLVDRNPLNESKGIEKQLQSFIATHIDDYGLSVLGDIFYRKTPYALCREEAIGSFSEQISDDSRITPTLYIDLVTFTKKGRLALIEMKMNDPNLAVAAQLLDYALFVERFKKIFCKRLFDRSDFHPTPKKFVPERFSRLPFEVFVVNNHYHPLFEQVMPYYVNKKMAFRFHQVILGHRISEWC